MSDPNTPGEQNFPWNLKPSDPDQSAAESETAVEPAEPALIEQPVPVEPEAADAVGGEPAAVETVESLFAAEPEARPEPPIDSQPEPVASTLAQLVQPVAATASVRLPAGEAGFAGVGEAAPTETDSTPATSRLLWWIVGGLIALVVVVAVFFFGSRIPALFGGASATPSATASPTPTALAPVGVAAWDDLFGGECVQPYTSPWDEQFTVVDCASPHAAQLVYRGTVPSDSAAFPGETAIAAQMNALCTQLGVFDITAAGAVPNLQVEAAYPVTAQQWDAGQRSYYCFVSRADGTAISGSLAGPGPQ